MVFGIDYRLTLRINIASFNVTCGSETKLKNIPL